MRLRWPVELAGTFYQLFLSNSCRRNGEELEHFSCDGIPDGNAGHCKYFKTTKSKPANDHQKIKVMKKTTLPSVKTFGAILALGILPVIVGMTGCTTGSRYEQSTGERIDDHGTSSRVRDALAADTQYKYESVSVETFKGTVQLSGFVNSRDQKNRAGDLAKNVVAVKQVVNNITVKESSN
jgi:hypothetical protein